jgi:hypothetical protein
MIEKEYGSCLYHRNCRGSDKRVMGQCKKCGREVSFSVGHLAVPQLTKENLICGRCLGR